MSFFFSSRRRHTRWPRDWSSDVCSSDLQPEKLEPAPALAVSFTETLEEKLAEQVVPQLTPDGLLVTVPEPLPALAVTSAFGALALAQLGKRKAPIRVWSSPPLEA